MEATSGCKLLPLLLAAALGAACGPDLAPDEGGPPDEAVDPGEEEGEELDVDGAEDGDEDSLGSLTAGLNGDTDTEERRCGNYRESATVGWTYPNSKSIRIETVDGVQTKLDHALAKGLDYRIQVRVAAEGGYTLWDSGKRSTSSYAFCHSTGRAGSAGCSLASQRAFPALNAARSARPYVRITMGKDGDGRASCTFVIWPLEAG